jgi:hypothetical protein
MSIFDQLGKQQREISELFCDTRRALSTDQRGLATVLFQLAANKLIACMRAEHAVVYPRFADVDGLVAEVAQARREHETIEDSINRLRIAGLHGDAWDAELDRLVRMFEQHTDLEELSLFPIAGLSLTTRELVKIGVDFAAYLARSTSVAGASITYAPAPVAAIPRIMRIALAPIDHTKQTIMPFDLVETSAVDEWELADTAYVFNRPEAA